MTTILIILFGMFLIYIGAKPQRKKAKTARIQTEMVPYAMHGINVRSRVDEKVWMNIAYRSHDLNRVAYGLKKGQCEVCRGDGKLQGFKHSLEAHEEWGFDHGTRTQKLMRIRSLCPLCHKAVHIGLADKSGYGEQVRQHMQQVNDWNADQVEAHIDQAKQTVKAMNNSGRYKLDLTYLNGKKYAGTHQFRFTTNETNNCRPNIYY